MGLDITGVYKHYWLSSPSSADYGSYLEVHFPADALAGFGGAGGVSNRKEVFLACILLSRAAVTPVI